MKVWSGDAVSDANLNSTFAPDAIVTTSVASQDGDLFPSITAALAASRKSIFVEPGDYSSETVTITASHDGTTIVGGGHPDISGTTMTTGVRLKNVIVNGASFVRLVNLGSVGSAVNGFYAHNGATHLIFEHCYAVNATSRGFRLEGSEMQAIRCVADGCEHGFQTNPASAGDGQLSVHLVRCHAEGNDGNGFFISDVGSDTGTQRLVTLTDCSAYGNSQGWVAAGFYVANGVSAALVNCQAINNGTLSYAGDGFYLEAPTATYDMASILSNCLASNNNGSGIQLSSASSRVALTSCQSRGNAVGDATNLASCPGYAGNGLTSPGTNILS